jgi:hypothetical protein
MGGAAPMTSQGAQPVRPQPGHVRRAERAGILRLGEIYSLFPSTCTDIYGPRFATANAGLLYTAKGTAALLVPFGNTIAAAAGGWHAVFAISALSNATATLMALLLLKPLIAAHHGRDGMENHDWPVPADCLESRLRSLPAWPSFSPSGTIAPHAASEI